MYRRISFVGPVLVSLCSVAGVVSAVEEGGKDRKTPPRGGQKEPANEKLHIVRVGDGDLQIVTSTELVKLRKKVVDDFKKAADGYTAAKKAAKKNKKEFTEPKPKKAVVKVLAGGLRTEEIAQKRLDKLKEAEKKAEARRTPKGKGERRTKGSKNKDEEEPSDEGEA